MMIHFPIGKPVLLVAGALILALALVGWFSTSGSSASAVAAEDKEILLSTSFRISRHASSMVATASTPTTNTMTPQTLDGLSASLEKDLGALQEALLLLEGRGYDDRVESMRKHVAHLASNIERIQVGRPALLSLHQESRVDHRRLNYEISKPLDAALVTSLDDQLDRMVRGDGDSGDPAGWHHNTLTAGEAILYHHLFNLVEAERMLLNKMKAASITASPQIMGMINEDYDSAAQRMESSLDYLTTHSPATLDSSVIPLSRELLDLGGGERNLWDKMYSRLGKSAAEQALIAANKNVLDEFLQELDLLVAEMAN